MESRVVDVLFAGGMPAGMEGFKVAERVLNEWKAENGITGPALGSAGAHQQGEATAEDPKLLDIGVGERMDTKTI